MRFRDCMMYGNYTCGECEFNNNGTCELLREIVEDKQLACKDFELG